MIYRVSTFFGFLTLIFPFVTAGHWSRRHQEVAYRARGDVDLHERQFVNAKLTWYNVGLGACGQYNQNADFVVAICIAQFVNTLCFAAITIYYEGKSAVANIVDACEVCPKNGLDLSPSLFSYFDSTDKGVIYGTWTMGNGGEQTTSPTTSEPPATSTSDLATTSDTPTYTPPSPTSISPTSTTFIPTTASTSSTYLSTSLLAVPTPGLVSTPSMNNPQNIPGIYIVLVEIGEFLTHMKNK